MYGTKTSTNKKNKFYKSRVQASSRGGGDWPTKFEALCANFFIMGSLMKSKMENGLIKLLDLYGQAIDMSDQDVSTYSIQVYMIKKEIK